MFIKFNKNKLRRIFNNHSWKIVESQRVIAFQECLNILKNLKLYPDLVTNSEIKVYIDSQEYSKFENFEDLIRYISKFLLFLSTAININLIDILFKLITQ